MSASPEPGERLGLRYWPGSRWLLTLLGMGPRRAGVVLTGSELRVRAWPFRLVVPLTAPAAVRLDRAPWWALVGVHTSTRGRWIVTGAPGSVVRLDLAEPCEGTFAGIRIRVTRLDVGTVDDAGLLRRLTGSAAPSANRMDGGPVDPLG